MLFLQHRTLSARNCLIICSECINRKKKRKKKSLFSNLILSHNRNRSSFLKIRAHKRYISRRDRISTCRQFPNSLYTRIKNIAIQFDGYSMASIEKSTRFESVKSLLDIAIEKYTGCDTDSHLFCRLSRGTNSTYVEYIEQI